MGLVRRYALAIVATIAGAVLGTVLYMQADRLRAPDIVISDPLPDTEIAVVIDGAVATPGMYRVAGDSRLADVLDKAGGASPDADLASLNLAERLIDAQEITIPTKPTTEPEQVSVGTQTPGSLTGKMGLAAGPININVASIAELDSLPNIGPVIAQLIVERRDSVGPFESIDDLAEISGISERMVEELRDRVSTQ